MVVPSLCLGTIGWRSLTACTIITDILGARAACPTTATLCEIPLPTNMRLSLFIAWRYLRGLRGINAAPLLSRISMAALGVGAAALIILFSVFNGFDNLVKELYKSFYPELRITAARGKFFEADSAFVQKIQSLPGVDIAAPVLMDKALASANEEQLPVTLIGADNRFFETGHITPYITDGDTAFDNLYEPIAIAGGQICYRLGVTPEVALSRISINYPNPRATVTTDPTEAFQSLLLVPAGVFQVQPEFDNEYVIVPLPLAREVMLQDDDAVSSIDLKLKPRANAESLKKQLAQVLGSDYKIQTRFEQNKSLYGVIQTEKWAIYAILVFVLLIASVTMIGAISLLALEKQKDAGILRAMGAMPRMIFKVFIAEGALWGLIGGTLGLLLGLLICLGQQHFGWIRLEGFVIDAYPVQLEWKDFVLVFFTVICIGALAAWAPAARVARSTSRLTR